MFAHKVNQLFKTRKEVKEILILNKRNALEKECLIVNAEMFLYVLEVSFPGNTEKSTRRGCRRRKKVGLIQTLSFSSTILKVAECNGAQDWCVYVLTSDGAIWKLDYSAIFENYGKILE